MRRLQIRFLSLPALAFLVLAGNAGAQDKSPALLNTLEVQQLVKRAEPGDNARLAAHFTALADRYVAETKQHTTMASAYAGNAGRSLATGMSVHCKQLGELNTKSATEARGLATYHQKLAAGTAAAVPTTGTRFEGGTGARTPTVHELNALAAKATSTSRWTCGPLTPANHHSLEEYFLTLAKRYTADATEHATMANTYRGTKIAQAVVHCDSLVGWSRDAAKEATAAAEMHKQLAGVSR